MTATALRRGDGATSPSDDGGRGGIPHRRLILGGIVVVVVAAVAVWLVAVRGVHQLSAGQVRSAARVADGTPLVRLDTEAIRIRVEALPDVATATVTTSFPSTVTITISERAPLGVVRSAAGGFMLVDRTGDQFRRVSTRPAHLPLFVVPDGTDSRTTGGAVATVAAALTPGVRSRVASIQALDPQAITLVLNNGRVVRWGSAQRSADKSRILPALLHQPGTQFDVTDPDQPYVR